MVLVMILATLISSFVLCCLLIPSVWASIMALDDGLDAQDFSVTRVASRNPFRQSGPPACMAKLIMMRHKLNQTNTRKRRVSVGYTCQPRPATPAPRTVKPRLTPRVRFGSRGFARQSH